MTITLLVREALSRDSDFKRRVRAAATVSALGVCDEATNTTLHAARRSFAVGFLRSPDSYTDQFALAAAGHSGITSDRVGGVEAQPTWTGTDADLQFVVTSVFPALAVVVDA